MIFSFFLKLLKLPVTHKNNPDALPYIFMRIKAGGGRTNENTTFLVYSPKPILFNFLAT